MTTFALQPKRTVNPLVRVRFSQFVKEEILTGPTRTQSVDSSDIVALLGRVADNDRAAFATLYDALSPVVFGTILKTLRSRDHAEEVTQEVFLEIWRKAAEWDPRLGSPTTWILMMARRRSIDRIRSEEALKRREDRVAPTWATLPNSEVEEAVTSGEDRLEVREGLAALSDVQREVIELAYFGDHTYVEVADMLDLPLGTVKTRMRDGLMRLRQGFGVVT
jgi:RNA polymerase sigma-70 factor (ECF subfamily)